jgi:hypothetical protein
VVVSAFGNAICLIAWGAVAIVATAAACSAMESTTATRMRAVSGAPIICVLVS